MIKSFSPGLHTSPFKSFLTLTYKVAVGIAVACVCLLFKIEMVESKACANLWCFDSVAKIFASITMKENGVVEMESCVMVNVDESGAEVTSLNSRNQLTVLLCLQRLEAIRGLDRL